MIAALIEAEDEPMLQNASNTFKSEQLWREAFAELMAAQEAYSNVEDDPQVPELLVRCIWLRRWRAECQIHELLSRLE